MADPEPDVPSCRCPEPLERVGNPLPFGPDGGSIDTEDFRTLNRCLDHAIAGAVAEYANQERAAERSLQSSGRG